MYQGTNMKVRHKQKLELFYIKSFEEVCQSLKEPMPAPKKEDDCLKYINQSYDGPALNIRTQQPDHSSKYSTNYNYEAKFLSQSEDLRERPQTQM